MWLGLVAAIVAAISFGAATVLQAHGAATQPAANGSAPSIRSTIAAMVSAAFLIGIALDTFGFLGSAVASRLLPLFLAQPIVSANLVVTALLATAVLGITLSNRDRVGIGLVAVSLVTLALVAGSEGHRDPGLAMHLTVLLGGLALLGFGCLLIRLRSDRLAVATALLGGALFGLVSVAVRLCDGLSPFDLGALLSDPVAYAIPVCGAGGFYLFTVALQTGGVAGAAAAMAVGETVVPSAIGVWLLGDSTRAGLGAAAAIAFVTAVVGAVIVALSPEVQAVEAAT